MNAAIDHFLLASALISEGDRQAASIELRAALRALERSRHPNAVSMTADINNLLATVERNAKEAA